MKKPLLLFLFAGMMSVTLVAQSTRTIAVVFHVLYNNAAQNVNDSCLLRQIQVLNEDYGNADTTIATGFPSLVSDCNIRFGLAGLDPGGNPTTGIERRQVTQVSFATNDAMKHYNQGGLDAWSATCYLNIWVCNLGSSILGYAQGPGGTPATDGVVLNCTTIGFCGAAPYHRGRVGTTEIGYWLGLRAFGPASNCSIDNDNVPDTPTYTALVFSCPGQNVVDTCHPTLPGVMYMNFMAFTDDVCKGVFTQGQKSVMWNTLTTTRANIGSANCQVGVGIAEQNEAENDLEIFPNPTNGIFQIRTTLPGMQSVRITDLTGRCVQEKNWDGQTAFQLDLPAGMYQLTAVSAKGTITRPLLLIR